MGSRDEGLSEPHLHEVQIYYEDTDLTGAVYHANYLAYFERAREHCLGVEALVRLYREDGVGFVVHHAEVTYRAPSSHGDCIQVLSTARCESDYRVVFQHRVRIAGERQDRVTGSVSLVCVDRDNGLVEVPAVIRAEIARRWPAP